MLATARRKNSSSAGRRLCRARTRGLVLIAVMVCLAVAVLVCGVILKLVLSETRQVRMEQWRLQAVWLAESAAERAASKLAVSEDFAGETWTVSEQELGDGFSGLVTIAVEKYGDRPESRRVRIRADLLRDGERRARHSKEVIVELKSPSSETPS